MNPPNDPFPASEFDDWAGTYDASVSINQFPFFGYQDILARIVALAKPIRGMSVLDLGTGTGNLAARFAVLGCDVWCTDFSVPMLAQARQKIPDAHFVQHDLRRHWPEELRRPFDRIVSAYVFHHFELDEKIRILRDLASNLASGGRMIIGDIAFPNLASQERVKTEVGAEWEQEHYWLADESLAALYKAGLPASYTQVSSCAGMFVLTHLLGNKAG